MGKEIVELEVNTNIKSATAETTDWNKELKDVTSTIEFQKKMINEQTMALHELKRQQTVNSEWDNHIQKMPQKIAEATLELKGEKIALQGLKDEQKAATEKVKEFNQAQKDQDKVIKDGIGNFQVMGVSLNSLKKTFGQVIPTAKLMFSTIKTGLISTGIGALIVAFGVLMTWFKKTKVGAEALARIFSGVGAAVSVIVDRITGFASAVGSLLSGDISGGLSEMKQTFTGIGDEMTREVALAVELKRSLQDLANSERDLRVETAQRRAEIEDLKLKSQDLNLTEEERIQALVDASTIESGLMADRVKNAEEAVRIQKAQMGMSKNLKEDLDILADKEIALANIRRESSLMQQTLIRKTDRIRKQAARNREKREAEWVRKRDQRIRDNNKLRIDANNILEELAVRSLETEQAQDEQRLKNKAEKDLEEIKKSKLNRKDKAAAITAREELLASDLQAITDKANEDAEEAERVHEEAMRNIRNENDILMQDDERASAYKRLEIENETLRQSEEWLKASEQEKLDIGQNFLLKKQKLDDKFRKQDEKKDKAVNQAKVQLAQNAFGALAALAGENEQAGKAIAIAETIFNTQQGIMAAMGATSVADKLLPFPMRLANAMLVGVMGANAVKTIMTADSGAGASAGGGAISGSAATPSPQMMSGSFELGGGEEIQPMRAYVVSDEITESQNALGIIRRRATI